MVTIEMPIRIVLDRVPLLQDGHWKVGIVLWGLQKNSRIGS